MICEYCHQRHATETDVDGYPVCDVCIATDFLTCTDCEGLCHVDGMSDKWDFRPVCNKCADKLTKCDFCGYLCDSHECPDCREDSNEEEYVVKNPRV